MAENTASGQNIGSPVAATDPDTGDTLTYSLEGADAPSFAIDADTGQLQTDAALDFETDAEYDVRVRATDGGGLTDTIDVTITVTDVNEPPGAPAAPTFGPATPASLTVNWTAPANTGPAITDYDVRYREGISGSFTDDGYDGAGTGHTIIGLTAGTSYQVQVRATNADGTGLWSASGTATTADAPASISWTPPDLSEGEQFVSSSSPPIPTATLAPVPTPSLVSPSTPAPAGPASTPALLQPRLRHRNESLPWNQGAPAVTRTGMCQRVRRRPACSCCRPRWP